MTSIEVSTKNLPTGFEVEHDRWERSPRTFSLKKDGVLVATIRESMTGPDVVMSTASEYADALSTIWAEKKRLDAIDLDISRRRFFAQCDADREIAANEARRVMGVCYEN